MKANGHRLALVHQMAGRVRLRLPIGVPAAGIPERIAELDGVTACTWSPRTRSVLVLYDPAVVTAEAIANAVARHAGIADVGGHAITSRAIRPETAGQPKVSDAIAEAVGEVNQRIARFTNGTVDLAGLMPVGLTAWAIAELVRGRTAPLAWSSALWYAHGLYRDYSAPSTTA